ncbi:MAG: M48 family metallopeptidase [Sedimentitalea sp.]
MRKFIVLFVTLLAACDVPVAVEAPQTTTTPRMSPQEAARSFAQVVAAVEPVAEYECRRRTKDINCDFLIAVDRRRNAEPNAFQSEDEQGRPVITFTIGLIATARNADELAFVMGHEAAHHIQGHLARQRRNAEAGAAVFAGLATLTGGSPGDVQNALELGAKVGARSYSKDFELEADDLGTVITYRAGFNPLIGAEFFTRIPDPGDRFLGTHPPNAARVDVVRRAARRVAASG